MATRKSAKKRLVRVFFNTFYEDVVDSILRRVEAVGKLIRVSRSKIVPELYFIELEPLDSIDAREAARKIEEELRSNDRIFGVKAYVVEV
jgi:hypothetical protein